MLVRLGFIVAASIAAYTVKQVNCSKPSQPKPSERHGREESGLIIGQTKEEEEEEEVKTINSLINAAQSNLAPLDFRDNDDDDDLLPEFESLLSGEVEVPLSSDVYDVKPNLEYDIEMANNASELERLRNLVQELEEREVKLEGELLEYYGLKEQESDIAELQKQLKIKTLEIDMLNITINSLQAERKKLHEEIAQGNTAKKELEVARNKIKELQRQIQLDSNQTKGQLLLLKQQVTSLQFKEEEAAKKDAEVEKNLKALKELEVGVVELRRKNKELQHEKRELVVKLDAAEAGIADLSNTTESDVVTKAREELNSLRHANEDLIKQVEGLQISRFSEVEELVYLRWVNACLRYELRNYQAPSGKISAQDLSKSLSPKSQERAKRLMLEYAGSERGQGDTDLESVSSMPSSPGSEDFDNASIDSSSSRFSSISKKQNLLQKLKRWGNSKDDSAMASPTRSLGGGSPMRTSMRQRSSGPRGPLEALMLRNAGDSNAITTYGKNDEDPGEFMEDHGSLPPIRTRVDSNDSLNSVAASFQLMSKSVEGVADDKYPAFKDRHKLAMEREKMIKEKADQARAERFGGGSAGLSSPSALRPRGEREKHVTLPPKLAQIKEKVGGADGSAESGQQSDDIKIDTQVVTKMKLAEIEKRPPRVPRPPPRPPGSASNGDTRTTNIAGNAPPTAPPLLPPPPPGGAPRPPPPPGSLSKGSSNSDKVHRAPELVEFYQSLMKREAKKEMAPLPSTTSSAADARSNMIGEIANKSAFLLAVKADVESQGDFVQSLAAEVRAASFTNIEDLVAFVNWLDEELSFLVDERAVLKHFDWPEGKADALREAAFEYQDLMKLEKQVSSFIDDPKLPREAALKKMYSLLEKVEQSVYALLRTRDMAVSRYREFGIPIDWLSDSGVVGKIKLASVQLAKKYMKRVASELDALNGSEKEPNREFLLLQGVRFAFRVHQFAGGFDAQSMRAFEELRSRVSKQTPEPESKD
ncbi:Protein CHUP1, chloroplastic [Apostasia shenzhenica]|uniref:Protein CHUP1, chloroplastic n=1 Tax=Apostasia shenzhenica TaxID=1088818 RepID=A0A2I0B2N0_9ASPA|nr:Protein CHUP1, chloroplastic [Apostasia shenzhenica]